jgi:long-chain acyl-CoA synthetase
MHAHLTQGLRRAVQVNHNGVATIDGTRRRTWAEVTDRVARFAAGLCHLGIKPDSRVAIYAFNSDRYFELHYAVPWAGGALVPINTRLAQAEVRYILEDSGAELLIVDEACHALMGEAALPASIKTVVYLSDGAVPSGWHGYEELIARHAPAPDADRGDEDLAGIFYTGGSTGQSKGVMLSHGNLVANAVNAVLMIGYDRASVYLHAAPMFHLTDGMSTYSLSMVGGTHVFIPKFDTLDCLSAMDAHGVTNVCLVPTMIGMLLNHPEIARFKLAAMRQIQFGASPMPEATLRRAIEFWPDIKLVHGWGMTEISPLGTLLPHHLRDPRIAGDRLRSCGQAPPNCEVRILDEDDNEVPRGTIGELCIRGPIVMQGYWKKPKETAAALRNGWMHSGDAAYMDEEGFVTIVDRVKDMIISGGENVYSNEVENVISVIPGVAEVAVIGVPDERWGERVHAVIVPRAGAALTEEAIREACRKSIAGYKVPRSMEFRSEPLPLSAAGKVLKRALREPYWQGYQRAVN